MRIVSQYNISSDHFRMGARVRWEDEAIEVEGAGLPLRAVEADLEEMPDAAMTLQLSWIASMPSVPKLSAIAPPGPTRWSCTVADTVKVASRSCLMNTLIAASSF